MVQVIAFNETVVHKKELLATGFLSKLRFAYIAVNFQHVGFF